MAENETCKCVPTISRQDARHIVADNWLKRRHLLDAITRDNGEIYNNALKVKQNIMNPENIDVEKIIKACKLETIGVRGIEYSARILGPTSTNPNSCEDGVLLTYPTNIGKQLALALQYNSDIVKEGNEYSELHVSFPVYEVSLKDVSINREHRKHEITKKLKSTFKYIYPSIQDSLSLLNSESLGEGYWTSMNFITYTDRADRHDTYRITAYINVNIPVADLPDDIKEFVKENLQPAGDK